MNYIYYVVATKPNYFVTGGLQIFPLEVSRTKEITSLEDVQSLIPIVRKTIREYFVNQAKDENHPKLADTLEKMPLSEDDNLIIISYSLLRKE